MNFFDIGQGDGCFIVTPKDKGRLRWFRSVGKTKNGHSVILLLQYGLVTLLLGGDLNITSEHYLLKHYTGLDPDPQSTVDEELLVRAARNTFASDIAKACHHGSVDFTEIYLRAVNPVATCTRSFGRKVEVSLGSSSLEETPFRSVEHQKVGA